MSLSPLQSVPAKSAASQPLVDTASSPLARLTSIACTVPSTVPEPLPVKAPVSYSASTGVSCRSTDGKVKVISTGSSVTL
jgi:hypothetical protein